MEKQTVIIPAQRKKKKKESGRTSKLIIATILLFLFVFTAAVLIAFWHNGSEPSTLIVAVFGFCGCEAGLLGWIKNTKEKQETRRQELEDRAYYAQKGDEDAQK